MSAGTATLKDATSEAIRDWVTNVETTHYILGSAAGPHPYPMMARARSHAPVRWAIRVMARGCRRLGLGRARRCATSRR